MHTNNHKLIHLNDVKCIELSKTEEGSKSLRHPINFNQFSSARNQHLIPRMNQTKQKLDKFCDGLPVLTEKSDNWKSKTTTNDNNFVPVLDNSGQNTFASFVSASQAMATESRKKCGEFMSANQFLNPTYHLHTNNDCKKDARSSDDVSNPSTSKSQPSSKRVKISQTNNMDRYLKHERDEYLQTSSSQTSTTVLRSPLAKVPGSDTLYYSPTKSVENNVNPSSLSYSSACVKALWSNDDDDDFETPFHSEQKRKLPVRGKLKTEKRFATSSQMNKMTTKSEDEDDDIMSTSKFGLFGFTDSELFSIGIELEEKVDYFSLLPDEILENIFCRLPFIDLRLNLNRVCTSWNNIIDSEKFMPWKKMYHCLLKGQTSQIDAMKDRIIKEGINSIDSYLPLLIRCMKQFKPVTAKGGNMDESLKNHPKYILAKDLLIERFKDCMMTEEVPNPWCIIASIVVLLESVKDIEQMISCLLGGKSECLAIDLLDSLYFIASYLFIFKTLRLQEIWTGMHYRLYYALYLYENDSKSTVGQVTQLGRYKGQQSINKYCDRDASLCLTHEQMRICNHEIQPNQTIKIVAFAGSGKTTTLIHYTKMRPQLKFLLVVYNKSVQEHSKSCFPHENVDCFTGHSLAFGEVGKKFRDAKKWCDNIKVSDVKNILKWRRGENSFVQSKFVVDTLNAFMASADPFITTAHVPSMIMKSDGKICNTDHQMKMNLANDAERIWKRMININDRFVKLPHDGYLKLWQLQLPTIDKYDVILIDEAQDLTPAIADVLLRQSQPKILVGDPHQQIYSFRGAINAMTSVSPTHCFYLTQSFRFGPEISFVAASCLELYKNEKKKILVGNGIPGGILGDQVGQLAIIARTNYQLFDEVVKKCVYSDKDIKVSFAGGLDSYGFEMIEDMYSLMSQKNMESIRNGLIKRYVSKGGFLGLSTYAKETSDLELLGKLRIINKYNHLISSHIENIRKRCISDADMADIVFSTAHKSKGLEFDSVYICDDFLQVQEEKDLNCCHSDEFNLLYVAITRAKKRLILSKRCVQMLNGVGEKFLSMVSTKELLTREGFKFVCGVTRSSFTPNTSVTVVRKKLRQSNGTESNEGVFSPEAVYDNITTLKRIAGSPIS